ncbi:25058_t:CDS:1, partial [Racocetra persica]
MAPTTLPLPQSRIRQLKEDNNLKTNPLSHYIIQYKEEFKRNPSHNLRDHNLREK